MIVDKLPTTGWMILESSRKSKWKSSLERGLKELFTSAFIEAATERVKVDIVITKILPPDSLHIDTFIDVQSADKDVSDGLSYCYEFLRNFVSKDACMYKAYLLREGKRIQMFIVDFPKINKAIYYFNSSEEYLFFPKHQQN